MDVLEQDAARKLANWFEKCWDDLWCLDFIINYDIKYRMGKEPEGDEG